MLMVKRNLMIVVAVVVLIALGAGIRFFVPHTACKLIGGTVVASKGLDQNISMYEICASHSFIDEGKICLTDKDCMSGKCDFINSINDYGGITYGNGHCPGTKTLFFIGATQ